MKSEPVLILLNGLAAVVNVILIALVATGIVNLDTGQCAAIVAAVQSITGLASLVVRAQVSPSA